MPLSLVQALDDNPFMSHSSSQGGICTCPCSGSPPVLKAIALLLSGIRISCWTLEGWRQAQRTRCALIWKAWGFAAAQGWVRISADHLAPSLPWKIRESLWQVVGMMEDGEELLVFYWRYVFWPWACLHGPALLRGQDWWSGCLGPSWSSPHTSGMGPCVWWPADARPTRNSRLLFQQGHWSESVLPTSSQCQQPLQELIFLSLGELGTRLPLLGWTEQDMYCCSWKQRATGLVLIPHSIFPSQ